MTRDDFVHAVRRSTCGSADAGARATSLACAKTRGQGPVVQALVSPVRLRVEVPLRQRREPADVTGLESLQERTQRGVRRGRVRLRRRCRRAGHRHQAGVGDVRAQGARSHTNLHPHERALPRSRAALRAANLTLHDLWHEAGSRIGLAAPQRVGTPTSRRPAPTSTQPR
jgi:hypothetical protein